MRNMRKYILTIFTVLSSFVSSESNDLGIIAVNSFITELKIGTIEIKELLIKYHFDMDTLKKETKDAYVVYINEISDSLKKANDIKVLRYKNINSKDKLIITENINDVIAVRLLIEQKESFIYFKVHGNKILSFFPLTKDKRVIGWL